MFARMVIGEAISEEQVREFARIYISDVLPDLKKEPGFESARFMVEDGKALLCLKASQNLLDLENWFKQQAILPLVVALPHSPRPRGQLPPWLGPRPQDRPRR